MLLNAIHFSNNEKFFNNESIVKTGRVYFYSFFFHFSLIQLAFVNFCGQNQYVLKNKTNSFKKNIDTGLQWKFIFVEEILVKVLVLKE